VKAVQLPVLCVSSALTNLDRTRRGYEELADRGQRLIARLRGTSFDELEDRFEDTLQGTRLAAPYDRAEDALEDVTENVTAFVRSAPARVRKATGATAKTASGAVDQAVGTTKENAEAPKGIATPAATQPDRTPVHSAATPEVVETVELITATVGGPVVDREDLPLPDFDHLTLGAVRGSMRSLDLSQLVQLRDYEKDKGNRLPIVTMLDNRIAKLATDPTATPSTGKPDTAASKAPAKRAKRSVGKVSPATANEGASAPTAAFGGLGASIPGKG